MADRSADVFARLLRTRWLVRAPIHLYRARLGFVFGSRLLLLEHRGRSSGLPRYVVLEVVGHPTPTRYVVVAGFGDKAQWLQNVTADPHVRVQLGSHAPRPATASRLGPEEGAAVLAMYARDHPRAWEKLRPVLEKTLDAPIDESGTALPVVALDLDPR